MVTVCCSFSITQQERAERHENERFGEESVVSKCKAAEEEGADRAAVCGEEINDIVSS